MIVKFKFDKEKDLFNIWETSNSDSGFGYDFKKQMPKELIEICRGKKYEKSKEILKKRLNNVYKRIFYKEHTTSLNKSWASIEKEYFKRLKKITKIKFPFKKVNAYLTTASRCPYRPHWRPPAFYFNYFATINYGLATAGHELMHIHLHNINWWKNVEKEIGYDKTHDLKEALTELLNLEFKDLWLFEDKGYPNHIKLRKYISQQWKKEKDFEKLTNNTIKWIKRNGIK